MTYAFAAIAVLRLAERERNNHPTVTDNIGPPWIGPMSISITYLCTSQIAGLVMVLGFDEKFQKMCTAIGVVNPANNRWLILPPLQAKSHSRLVSLQRRAMAKLAL